MAETHVLSALHDKYRQIKGELAALDNQCDKLRNQMVHLERTITLFTNDWSGDELTGKRPYRPSRWSKRGQGLQTALAVLRQATAPMSAREIIIEVIKRLNAPLPEPQTLYRQSASMNTQLAKRVGKDIVRHEGKPVRWSITPPAASNPPIGG